MTTLESFIKAIEQKPAFPAAAYADKLQSACRNSTIVSEIRSSLPGNDNVPAQIDGQDCSTFIRSLAVSTCARGLGGVTDSYGFHNIVDSDGATKQAKLDITDLIPYAMAEHINSHLSSQGQSGLKALCGDAAFTKSFDAELMKPAFIKRVKDRDHANNTHELGMTLLFIHQFFASGGSYSMLTSLPAANTALDAATPSVTAAWMEQLSWSTEARVKPFQDILWMWACLSSIYTRDGLPDTGVVDGIIEMASHFNHTLSNSAQAALRNLASNDPGAVAQYNGLSSYTWGIWDSRANSYVSSMLNATNLSNSWTEHQTRTRYMGRNRWTEHWTVVYTKHGQALAEWCTNARNAYPNCIKAGPPDDNARTTSTETMDKPSISCFVPGTMVLTDTGSKAIETLCVGDTVITSTTDQAVGYCSDERVVHATHANNTETHVWGFNDEKPFFTAGHVFYTTTGLRAVNPILAILENPWLDVGRLRVGHKLLRARGPGEQYEFVQVKSLHSERVKCSTVHGVHLREGMRSYHANGYLVRVNYPEITLSTLAQDIISLAKDDQLQILRAMKDLAPLFRRFGGETVLEALKRETKYGVFETGKGYRAQGRIVLPQAHRKWHLHHVDAFGVLTKQDALTLPSLAVIDGVLFVDGQYCERAAIGDSNIRWSRPASSSNGWEHGACVMSRHGASGQGYMFYTSGREPVKAPTKQDRIRFVATMLKGDQSKTVQAVPSSTNVVADDDSEQFSLFYGKKTATATIEGQKIPLFDIVSTSTTIKSAGVVLPDVLIHDLDILQSALQKQLHDHLNLTKDQSIVRLYEVASTLDDKNDIVTTVTLLYPDLVYQASDDYALGAKAVKTYKDLTFKGVGSPIKSLPLLFTQLSFGYNWDGTKVQGEIIHYDPEKPGTRGETLGLVGDLKENAIFGHASRADAIEAAHKAYIAGQDQPDDRPRKPHESHAAPAGVLHAMVDGSECGAMSAQSLAELAPYNDADVHATSQQLLYETMLYHIDDKYRSTFFNEKKPEKLDPQLTGISKDVQDWITGTYGPAYICNRIDSIDDVTKATWSRPFTAAEQKKLRWFWRGKGSKSIYSAPQYAALNEVTAAVAVRSLHKCLDQYIKDKVPDDEGHTGGKKWSNALYKSQSTSASIKHLVDNMHVGMGTNLLSKHCNVMHALDADKTNANSLARKVRHKLEGDTSNSQPNTPNDSDETKKDEYMWCYDSMYKLIMSVLNDDPAINGDIKKSLLKDIQTLETEYNINAQDANDKKTAALLSNSHSMLQQMAALIRSIRLTKSSNIWVGMKGWAKATRVGGFAAKWGSNAKVSAAFKGFMILAGVGLFLGFAVFSYKRWDKLTKEQRADLILNTLIAVTNVVGGAIELWNMIKEYRATPTPADDVREQTASSILDDKQRTDLVDSDDELSGESSDDDLSSTGAQCGDDMQTIGENEETELDPMAEAKAADEAHAAKVAKNFNSAGSWVRGVLIVLSAAVTVLMIIQIAKNWDKMSVADKLLGVAQIVQQGLTVVVDAAGLAVEGLYAFGQIAMETLALVSTCLAWAGAILALIGFALMIALIIYDATKKPPPSPVEQWVTDHGVPFLASLDAPPDQKLSYTMTSSVKSGDTVKVTVSNKTSTPVTVAQINVYFQTGDDPSTLTTEEDYVVWAPGTAFQAPSVRAQPSDNLIVSTNPYIAQKNDKDKNIVREQVIISGAHDAATNPSMNVTVPANGSFEIQILGTISKAGRSTLEIEEFTVEGTPVSTFHTIEKK